MEDAGGCPVDRLQLGEHLRRMPVRLVSQIDVLIIEIEMDQHVRAVPHRSRDVGAFGEQVFKRLDRYARRAIPGLVVAVERREVDTGRR